jgi:DNA-binding PadR family transcriptional regulator
VTRRSLAGADRSAASPPDLTEDFSSTCVLLLLDERPATAAELCERLGRLGLLDADTDPARVEEILGALRDDGLVELGEEDLYALTLHGAHRLGIAADDLRSTQMLLDRFLARCGERLVH